MQPLVCTDQEAPAGTNARTLVHGLGLLLPTGLLLLDGLAHDGRTRMFLVSSAGATFLLALLIFRVTRQAPLRRSLAVAPCVVALICHWLARPNFEQQAFPHFVQGMLLLVGVGLFALQALMDSGAPALRRAQVLAKKLLQRQQWPASLNACRSLPEVKELKAALTEEVAPVLPLLVDSRPQVQIAGLGALEFRKDWRTGQPDIVLRLAQLAPQPEIRAAAVLALGNVKQRLFVEALAELMRDSDSHVRRAAHEALMWDCKRRWIWMRASVHDALADPRLLKDGPLTVPNGMFPPAAVSDLMAWATETGALGVRATQSLSLHYAQQLAESNDPNLLNQLREQVANPKAATVLRVELAHLLRKHGQLTPELLMRMIDPTNPSPLRLMAVEALLQVGPNERAVDVLREVARQPNRELALSASIIVQKYLHVDLGLAVGEPPPPVQSRQAAEVTRRVIEWARQAAEPASAGPQGGGW